jgi:O-antigen/teichoic acid export membrane protein
VILKDVFPKFDIVKDEITRWLNQMREYAWPFASWGLFTWMQVSSDRWALQAFSTTTIVGFYSVLYTLGYYPIQQLSNMVVKFISPVLYGRAGDGSDASRMANAWGLNKLIIVCALILTILATLLTAILHPWVFALLVAPEYREISTFLPWMVLSSGLFAAGQIACLSLMIGSTTRVLISPKIGIGVMGVVLNALAAYKWGLKGVVTASIVLSFIYLIWILVLVVKFEKQ